ncbi:MAG TPA: hypothetical protein VMR86_13095 [Myxococcota bacterium]|nr:hypothetical protein [Myxococcota bacterium]
MRKLIHTIAAAVVLTGLLAVVPTSARAVGYEDSLDDCHYPESFDVFVMRPLAFTGLLGGSLLYGVLAPVWLAFDARDAGSIGHNLVVEPAEFTFGRGIGQCSSTADQE